MRHLPLFVATALVASSAFVVPVFAQAARDCPEVGVLREQVRDRAQDRVQDRDPGQLASRQTDQRTELRAFLLIDENDDAVISVAEAAAAADNIFARIDDDEDGALSKDEFLVVRNREVTPDSRYRSAVQGARSKVRENRFADLDADSDGSITKQEYMTAAKSHYEMADTDDDGKVSPWEMRQYDWN